LPAIQKFSTGYSAEASPPDIISRMNESAQTGRVLDQQTAAFIQRHVSINLATTDTDNRPAVTRVFGCKLAPNNSSLTLFISSEHNQTVLDNILATHAIAVVFSRPSTHKTIQLKGTDARLVSLEKPDYLLMKAYRDSMIEELQGIGYPPSFTEAMILPPETLDTGVCFTPLNAYSQTPGPDAGKKLPV
jgi:hypothetical protein